MDISLNNQARDIFLYALEETRVSAAMERRVVIRAGVLTVDDYSYDLDTYERIALVALGKAAGSMAASFLRLSDLEAKRMSGIVCGVCSEHLPDQFTVFRGGHPSPNQASLDAAAAVLQLLRGLTERDLVVFLISGGGSSMMEQMLSSRISLAEIAATHKVLVESGAPIVAINALRKHLSAVKGGRLAVAAAPAEQLTIFVSDVPADHLDALASGPTVPDYSTVEEVQLILAEYGLAKSLPAEVVRLLSSNDVIETPKQADTAFARSRWVVLLDSGLLGEAAQARASELGWSVVIDSTCDDWSSEDAAKYLVQRLKDLRAAQRQRVCLISAGEVTVAVPADSSGAGGRNQHFALLCAELISGSDLVVLSAGSDGVDGNSPAAGGVVSGTTAARATVAGLSVTNALAAFKSYELLSRLGDTIMTGPTGNNLRDLRILLAP